MPRARNEAARLAQLLGGEQTLGAKVHTPLELEACARSGFSPAVLDVLMRRSIVSSQELYRWIVPRRTLAHRMKKRQRLSIEESNRVSKVVRIFALAADTLGDESRAKDWLRKPLRQFAGRAPMEMLETEFGARQLEDLLGRIAHGIAA